MISSPLLSRRHLLTQALGLGSAMLLPGCSVFEDTIFKPAPFDHLAFNDQEIPGPIERIQVRKGARALDLVADGRIVRSYPAQLGRVPVGHKQQRGDLKTPEGAYRVSLKNPGSAFHLGLGVSYPNRTDLRDAYTHNRNPGSNIMLHGQPNGIERKMVGDWTAGCVALQDTDIAEVYALVNAGCQINIYA